MNKVVRTIAGSLAFFMGFAHAALAGNSYGADPTVADNGSDAGVFLLAAVLALIVIKTVANPASSKNAETETDPEKTE